MIKQLTKGLSYEGDSTRRS